MLKRIKSIFNNYIKGDNHWAYSLSLASFVVGTLMLLFATIEDNTCITILSSCMFILGMYFFPNFKASYIDSFAKGSLKFSLSIIATIIDVLFIRSTIINIYNSQSVPFYYYIISLLLTFFLARYYIDILYKIIFTIVKEVTEKHSTVNKVWKLILSLVGFLVTLVSLANSIISIVSRLIQT